MLRWEGRLDAVTDNRRAPRIPTQVVLRSVVVMFLARLGSLNSLEQSRASRFWRKWLGDPMPSADTIGRVCALAEPAEIRALAHHVYSRLKRMKAMEPPAHGLMAAVLDGHESHATYRRCCQGCLKRVLHTAAGDRIQYYHRHVTIQLLAKDMRLLLDAEPIAPGEDEVATAIRLLERVIHTYPRAFDVVLGDALYADSRFFNYILGKGKDAMAVLKDDRRDLLEDARNLFEQMPPVIANQGKTRTAQWDIEGFTSWPQVHQSVRVVASNETRTVKRQIDGRDEQLYCEWIWVTTLAKAQATTKAVVQLGHDRWKIENEGFNELTNRQHGDHVYKHDACAMLVFCLLAMLCMNVFEAFYRRNLKPALRWAVSMLHISRQIAAELYQGLSNGPARAPT